jgi:hypothetical protein
MFDDESKPTRVDVGVGQTIEGGVSLGCVQVVNPDGYKESRPNRKYQEKKLRNEE